VKLWFDEDLSPTLVRIANERGFEATCNRDRGTLGSTDLQLRRLVQAEGYAFVTDNVSDFRPMYARDAIHPGLVVIPGGAGRDRQQQLARIVIEWIVTAAAAAGEPPADFLVNALIEIDDDGACSQHDLPHA